MDSSAYKYLIIKLLENYPEYLEDLPVELTIKNITVSDHVFRGIGFFLSQLIQNTQINSADTLIPPDCINKSSQNKLSELFRQAHLVLAEEFRQTSENDTRPFKRNGTALLSLLSNLISAKWLPGFKVNDVKSYAMCCFLLEAGMHIGWCPNSFENSAKRAAHLYFTSLKKSLYCATDNDIPVIVGYLQASWACAQKTEGIEEKQLEWESDDLIRTYSLELMDHSPIQYTLFRMPMYTISMIVPEYTDRIPHPLGVISSEKNTGLTLISNDRPLRNVTLIDRKVINRSYINGIQLVYSCTTSDNERALLSSIFQIYLGTIYRTDVLGAIDKPVGFSAELRLENPTYLKNIAENDYYGEGPVNMAISIISNPFSLKFQSQESEGVALFKGSRILLSPGKTIETIVAWTVNRKKAIIHRTNLLGIFDISKYF